jgi:hypothetical protein
MTKDNFPLIIAFYLPQYHPITENNAAWGTGFTEWNNVVRAKPKYPGHHQPQLPKDLGFYDLRLNEARADQTKMAMAYGLDAFCYYSYWFNNKAVLGLPLDLEFSATDRDFPICLCWANENWTRAWDGREADVILTQDYTDESLTSYYNYLISKFKHPRYLRINDHPVFLVYSPEEVPPETSFPEKLRQCASMAGIERLHLIAVKHGRATKESHELLSMGYDEVLLFQPNKNDFPAPTTVSGRIKSLIRKMLPASLFNRMRFKINSYQSIDYKRMVRSIQNKHLKDFEMPCIFPSWDNTARRSISTIIQNDIPDDFGRWLCFEIDRSGRKNSGTRAIFINAWNEWAEGCHLEPDQKHAREFLDQILKCKRDAHI